MYTQEQFLQDVKAEADALRQHATAYEVAKLNFETLDSSKSSRCIYGQMTDYCYSQRAAELIQQCTPRYFRGTAILGNHENRKSITDIIAATNSKRVKNFVSSRQNGFSPEAHFSAIEAYIGWNLANNADLIAYLKGETDTLTL